MLQSHFSQQVIHNTRPNDVGQLTTLICSNSLPTRFGRNVFVGCVVTSASTGSDVMGNIMEELKL